MYVCTSQHTGLPELLNELDMLHATSGDLLDLPVSLSLEIGVLFVLKS
jgi:hypothetical protein